MLGKPLSLWALFLLEQWLVSSHRGSQGGSATASPALMRLPGPARRAAAAQGLPSHRSRARQPPTGRARQPAGSQVHPRHYSRAEESRHPQTSLLTQQTQRCQTRPPLSQMGSRLACTTMPAPTAVPHLERSSRWRPRGPAAARRRQRRTRARQLPAAFLLRSEGRGRVPQRATPEMSTAAAHRWHHWRKHSSQGRLHAAAARARGSQTHHMPNMQGPLPPAQSTATTGARAAQWRQ